MTKKIKKELLSMRVGLRKPMTPELMTQRLD